MRSQRTEDPDGSGPSDLHNGGFFDVLRTHLADAGVAVLAYDKRGAGKSTGAWASATVDDLADDAAAAVAALQAHARVAADAVGVLGHSEGGWVALRLSVRLNAPGHLIVTSCSAVSFAESELFALTTAGAEPDTAPTLMRELAAADARLSRSRPPAADHRGLRAWIPHPAKPMVPESKNLVDGVEERRIRFS